MRSEKQDFARAVLIDREHWDVPVRVRLRPYVQFSRRLNDELEKLVTRWARTTASNAPAWQHRRR